MVWTQDEIAYIAPDANPVWRFSPQTGALSIERDSGLSNSAVHFRAQGLFNPAGPAWNAALPLSPETATHVGVSFGTGGTEYAFLDRQTHQVVVITNVGHRLETGLSARLSGGRQTSGMGWELLPARDGEGHLYLAGVGVLHRLEHGHAVAAIPALYQPRPIIDASTGLLVGGFDDRQAVSLAGDVIGTALLLPDHQGHDRIVNVAVASAGEIKAVRMERENQGGAILVQQRDGPVAKIDCPVRDSGRPPVPPADVTLENWGQADRPIMVRRRALRDGSRGLVVVWQGGPGETFADGGAANLERLWLGRGFDVAVVDGSGSQGVELGSRLREHGMDAVLADAEDVARHLADTVQAERPILIEGGSFGGIAAAETARRLADARPEAAPPGLLLIAPWMRYRDPAEYNGEGRERLDVDYARLSEAAAFGPIATYAQAMDQWRDGFAYDGPVLAIFGGADRIVRLEDIWPSAAGTASTKTYMDTKAGHSFLGSDIDTQAAITAWLEDHFPRLPSN